ncbi:MAG: hypothetical protein WD021_00225 [Rhodothermales bacterium]
MIKNIFVVLHVITAAGWFGVALMLTSISRSAAETSDRSIRDVGTKAVGMMNVFVVATFLFGLIAFLAGGGFAVYGPVYHTSLLLVLILILVQFFMIRSGWISLVKEGGAAARKKVAMGVGIGHLLWLVVLILMFSHYFAI